MALWPDAASEKKTRGALKAATDRALIKDRVVIVDSLNYIKGYRRAVPPGIFSAPMPLLQSQVVDAASLMRAVHGWRRYELWCIARALATRYAVVHCDAAPQRCTAWNAERLARNAPAYEEAVMEGLKTRFEKPDSKNRWEAPLFTCAWSSSEIHPPPAGSFHEWPTGVLGLNPQTHAPHLTCFVDTGCSHQAMRMPTVPRSVPWAPRSRRRLRRDSSSSANSLACSSSRLWRPRTRS